MTKKSTLLWIRITKFEQKKKIMQQLRRTMRSFFVSNNEQYIINAVKRK